MQEAVKGLDNGSADFVEDATGEGGGRGREEAMGNEGERSAVGEAEEERG